MQERRTTVRVAYHARAQYCSSDDFRPRDGLLVNLGARGAGLLAREAQREGNRVTLSFALPGARETLTATGLVRWSGPPTQRHRWHPVGLEWLPLEDTARHRLHDFLTTQTREAAEGGSNRRLRGRGATRQQSGWWTVLWVSLLIGGVGVVGLLWLSQENRQLESALQQRDVMIGQLERQEGQLRTELGATKEHLALTTSEVAQLDQQANYLGGEVQRLSQDVERFQQSYVQVREEREQLIQRVLELEQQRVGLEQERAQLKQRLSSTPDLRRAIREAITARRQQRQEIQRSEQVTSTAPEVIRIRGGNQGYLVRQGHSTVKGSKGSRMLIHVHDLEPINVAP